MPLTTADYLEFHARHQPAAVAVIDRDRKITYAEFHRDLAGFTRGVAELGLPVGATVAVSGGNLYTNWLLLLACENLGLVTAPFTAGETDAAASLLSYVDMVLAAQDRPDGAIKRFHRITPAWLAALRARGSDDPGPARVRSIGPDDPVRIARSSGTTGGQKMMLYTRRIEDVRHMHFMRQIGATKDTVCLIAHDFAVSTAHMRATVCLRLGATCITNMDLPGLIAHGCTLAWLQPVFLQKMLDNLPPGFVKPRNLRIDTGGAPLPPALRERVLRQFASEIGHSYATNEVGWISVVGADGIGTVLPGVEVEIVDEWDQPVPARGSGRVRVKTQSMVDGYLDHPEATARMFRDGWFYSGDVGMMAGPRRLKIVGRHDEVLNVHGIKVAPEVVEDGLKRIPGVADVAVTGIDGPEGLQQLCVAYVRVAGTDAESIERSIRRTIPFRSLKVAIRAVDRLPRTDNDKIRRLALKALFGAEAPPA